MVNTYSSGLALRRRGEILKLVSEKPVRSQEELAGLLAERGFSVAQPTLSRDIKDLGLVKTAAGYAASVMAGAGQAGRRESEARWEEKLSRVFRSTVLTVVPASSLVVVKTPPAQAHPVARVMDESPVPEWAGTIAGDDTVFIATESPNAAAALARRLRGYLELASPSSSPARQPRLARRSRRSR